MKEISPDFVLSKHCIFQSNQDKTRAIFLLTLFIYCHNELCQKLHFPKEFLFDFLVLFFFSPLPSASLPFLSSFLLLLTEKLLHPNPGLIVWLKENYTLLFKKQ